MSLVTPYSALLNAGTYRVTVPSSVTSGANSYTFLGWSDGVITLTRNITLNANTTLSVAYQLVVPTYPPPTPTPLPNPYPIYSYTTHVQPVESGNYNIIVPATVEA